MDKEEETWKRGAQGTRNKSSSQASEDTISGRPRTTEPDRPGGGKVWAEASSGFGNMEAAGDHISCVAGAQPDCRRRIEKRKRQLHLLLGEAWL